MKKIYLCIAMFMPFLSIAQIQSNCTANAYLKNLYADDVANLAFQRLYQTHNADTSKIEIPTIHTDSIWNGMAAIFNLNNQLEADSVFGKYCIHEYFLFNTIENIHIDTFKAVWYNNWKNNILATGNSSVDSFLNAHGFYAVSFNNASNYPFNWSFTLKTSKIINLKAFVDSFKHINGEQYAEASTSSAGDGNHIKYDIINGKQKYSFKLGFGDCPAGCIESIIWNYAVDSNCMVTFLSKDLNLWSSPKPHWATPVNCDINNGLPTFSTTEKIAIYPNPAHTFIQIDTKNINVQKYRLTNNVGQIVQQNDWKNNRLDISKLPNGLYLLQVIDANQHVGRAKFIKE